MTNTNATNFRKNMFEYLNLAVDYNDVVHVSTKSGNAVVMNEDDYNGIMETLQLLSAPGMKERMTEGINASPEDCEAFEW